MYDIFYSNDRDNIANDLIDNATPTVPRGKRSDITENDRISFVSSYGDLLKLLDEMDNKENISDDTIEAMINN